LATKEQERERAIKNAGQPSSNPFSREQQDCEGIDFAVFELVDAGIKCGVSGRSGLLFWTFLLPNQPAALVMAVVDGE
jgi:hypothetical protein